MSARPEPAAARARSGLLPARTVQHQDQGDPLQARHLSGSPRQRIGGKALRALSIRYTVYPDLIFPIPQLFYDGYQQVAVTLSNIGDSRFISSRTN